ncbi:hypothetical protein J4E85_008357 [Alternaria conjuncta]|uniref:uncharacterized protein n=1 Tax=Alternaria conjuncta TaxID=181017 RepID=UPI00221EA6C6|nr:uncharacterized protein J4E85_008357 [Alternaria conjuncta]KAI4923320.1 hypothetical protein J4E85_008357 [Alternaria conjuncta]
MRAKFFETCDVVSVTQIARSTMESPDDVEMYQIIDTSLVCPAKRESEHQRPMARHRTETSDKMTFEPSPLESRKFFIRAPSLEYSLNGSIKIGNVITDIFLPQDPIAKLQPLAEIITMTSSSEGTRKRGDHSDASAKLYAAFGSQAKGKHSADIRTEYDFDNVDTLMLERNPRAADVTALCGEDPEVQDALRRGPIYFITGLKVARGLRYSTIQLKESEVGLGTQGNVTNEVAIQANLDMNAGTDGAESHTVLGDVILAYRLHIVKKEGWRWRGEAALGTRAYWPGNAGFLGREEMRPEGEVETKSLSAQDLKHFAEDEGYETGSILMTDDEEAWSMACVED